MSDARLDFDLVDNANRKWHIMRRVPWRNFLSIDRHPDGYLAYFPALEECNTWGITYEEAIKHAEETLTLYLESFDELDKSIPEKRAGSEAGREEGDHGRRGNDA